MTTESILAPIAALSLPDQSAMTTRADRALAFIEAFQVDSAENYGLAADELKAIKTKAASIEQQRTSLTVPLNNVLRGINDLFRGPADTLAKGEKLLKGKMLAWDQEQERLAAAERKRAEDAARAERERIAAEAAERQRIADEATAAAAAAAKKGDTEAAAVAQAAADRANAESQTLATTAQLVVAAPVATIEKTAAKGISTSKKIDFDVTSLRLLVAYIATGKVYEEGDPALAHPELLGLLVADIVRLRAYVKGLGMACNLPGVRVFEERVMSARAA